MTIFKRLFGIILFFLCNYSNGQSNLSLAQRVLIPSPEAQAFMKFGNYPVDHSTGVPKIDIPLYEIKAGKLSLPVSLSYHAGGIKVNDLASCVGQGWALNAGGMVARSINQVEDEGPGGFLGGGQHMTAAQIGNFPAEPIDNPGLYDAVCNEVKSIFFGGKDGRSDDYYYAVGGKLSGQFVYDVNNNLQKLSHTDDKIIRKVTGTYDVSFEVVGDDGTRYLFDEKQKILSATGFWPSSWLITQIISNDGADTVFFEYNHYEPFSYSIKSFGTDWRSGVPRPDHIYSNMNYDANVLLKKIRYRGGSLAFNYEGDRLDLMPYRLRSVVINRIDENNIEQSIKKYEFVHDYFRWQNSSNKYYVRLKLTEIRNYDQSNTYVNSYSFQYNPRTLPPMPSVEVSGNDGCAQDYWGYFNGRIDNTHLIPLIPDYAVQMMGASAVRTVSETDMKACSLERINFPTGGYTSFEFEANKLSSWSGIYSTGIGGLRIKKITSIASADAIPVVRQYEYNSGDIVNDLTVGRYSYNQYTDMVNGTPAPGGILNQNLIGRPYFYSNSILPLSNHSGSPVFYTSVSEIIDDNNGNKQKIEYGYGLEGDRNYEVKNTLYGNYNYSENSRYPEGYYANRSWARGYATYINYYKFSGGSYKLVKSVTNSYENKKEQVINTGLIVNEKIKRIVSDPTYTCTGEHPGYANFFYFDALVDAGIKKLVQQQEDDYDDNGRVLTRITNYSYGNGGHLFPTRISTTNSNGEVIVEKTSYVQDTTLTGSAETARQRLLAINYVSAVLNKNSQKNGIQINNLSSTYALFSGNKAYPSLLSNQYKAGGIPTELNFSQYDSFGNVLTLKQSNSSPVAYIWGYRSIYPIAEARNAEATDIAYTSFEGSYSAAEGVRELGNWQSAEMVAAIDNLAPTGSKAGILYTNGKAYTIYKQGLSTTREYVVTCWIKNGGNIIVTPAPQNTLLLGERNGWKLYQYTLSGTQSVSITSNTNQTSIDELRLYPKEALMSTFTFTPLVGMTSQCDANNKITYYEYDNFQRLSLVRDPDRKIIRQICYRYANSATTLCAGQITYYNETKEATFTKNNCGAGGVPETSIVYKVPGGKYSSAISQADADQQALNEINTQGQSYANNNTLCRYLNDEQSQSFTRNNCPAGNTTISVIYTVTESKYSSYISKEDANNKAMADISANGQDYANTAGVCIPPNATYAKIIRENVNTSNPNNYTADIVVRFYSDPNGTSPKSVSNLPVNYRKIVSSEDQPATNTDYSTTATGTSKVLLTGTTVQYYDSQIAGYWYIGYVLLSNSGYIIIN